MKQKLWLILSILLLVSFACTLGESVPPTDIPESSKIATSVALTLAASGQTPQGSAQPPTALPTSTPSTPPTESLTATPANTPTPNVPQVTVSENTNCRVGPGKVYDYIGALMIGEKATIVAKNADESYWVIENPDASGTCWLWGYYATVSGNTDNLPIYTPPPTPTPTFTPTPSFTPTPVIPAAPTNLSASKTCTALALPEYLLTVTLSWDDNANNEDGFYIFSRGTKFDSVGANQTSANISINTIFANNEFGVSAYNSTGESAQITVIAVCP